MNTGTYYIEICTHLLSHTHTYKEVGGVESKVKGEREKEEIVVVGIVNLLEVVVVVGVGVGDGVVVGVGVCEVGAVHSDFDIHNSFSPPVAVETEREHHLTCTRYDNGRRNIFTHHHLHRKLCSFILHLKPSLSLSTSAHQTTCIFILVFFLLLFLSTYNLPLPTTKQPIFLLFISKYCYYY